VGSVAGMGLLDVEFECEPEKTLARAITHPRPTTFWPVPARSTVMRFMRAAFARGRRACSFRLYKRCGRRRPRTLSDPRNADPRRLCEARDDARFCQPTARGQRSPAARRTRCRQDASGPRKVTTSSLPLCPKSWDSDHGDSDNEDSPCADPSDGHRYATGRTTVRYEITIFGW
jgi:hypothetical protein